MKGTGGMRKVRFAPPSWHTGKSGALRICYLAIEVADTIYMLDVFSKNEKANLTKAEQNAFKRIIERLRSIHES